MIVVITSKTYWECQLFLVWPSHVQSKYSKQTKEFNTAIEENPLTLFLKIMPLEDIVLCSLF